MPLMPPADTCPDCGAPLSAAMAGLCPHCLWADSMAPAGGDDFLPGYRLGEEIARGGMGIVYRAEQQEPQRAVAVKMLRPHLLEQPSMKERFRQEASAAAALQHPGILPVYEVGESDDIPWFTMMLAEGGTLSARQAQYSGQWRETALLMAHLTRAVGHAHERGVLHRDLKPGNILFDAAGRAYVCDFGLAKVATAGDTTPDWTLSVQLLGTPHYLPPEVAAGTLKQTTTAGDIYALGVILYELLAGHLPFDAENIPALLRKIADEEPSTPVPRRSETGSNNCRRHTLEHAARPVHATHYQLKCGYRRSLEPVSERQATGAPPADLAAIAMKCLEKSPARRYSSAAALADDLDAWLAGKPVTARRLTRRQKFGRWVRRNPLVSGLAALLALSLLITAVLIAGKNASLTSALNTSRQLTSEALTNLGESHISEARLWRGSVSLGQRENAIALLQRAAMEQADPARLAVTAAAALATPDLRIVHRWPVVPDTRPVLSPSFQLWTVEAAMATAQNPFRDNLPPGVIVRRLA